MKSTLLLLVAVVLIKTAKTEKVLCFNPDAAANGITVLNARRQCFDAGPDVSVEEYLCAFSKLAITSENAKEVLAPLAYKGEGRKIIETLCDTCAPKPTEMEMAICTKELFDKQCLDHEVMKL